MKNVRLKMFRFALAQVLVFFVLAFNFSSNSYSQCAVLDYTMAASSGTFSPISGGTPLSTLSVDEAISPATEIGFTFKYLNRTYSKFFVSTNGYVSFESVTGASTSLTTVAKPVIAPLIGDLSGVGGTASYVLTGSAPNRVLTVEWLNWKWLFSNSTATISMQVKLYETSGNIEFIYNPGAGTPNGAANAGLAGSSTSNTATYGYLSNLTSSATFGTTATATTTKPVAGQMFTFTPLAGVVTMLTQPVESKTFYTNDAPFTLTATASGTGTLTYQWEQSTNGGITWANAVASTILTGVTTNTLTITKPTATYAGYGYRLKVTSSSSTCPAYSNPSYLSLYNGSVINAGGGGTNNTHDLKIHIGNTGQIQVVKTNISQVFDPLYFPSGPSTLRNYNGIFLTVGTNYFGPVSNWSGTPVEFTPVSHNGGSANGSGTDELVLKATTGGLDYLLYVTYTYVYPNPYVNINYRLVVPQGNTQRVKLWHGIDTYLQGGDNGPAYIQGVAPYYSMGVKKDPSFEAFRFRSGLPWSGYYSGTYTTMNSSYIRTATNFPNTLDYTATTDNGIGWMYDGGANTAPGEYVTNSDLVFELDPAPTYSSQPSASAITYCANATSTPLTVTVANASSYQWYRNTSNSNTGGILIQGATTTSYSPPTNANGTYYYYCVASSAFDNIPSNVSGAITVVTCSAGNDTDGDGVPNVTDIDDDNDGVLDITEQYCTTVGALTDLYGPTYWKSISWTGGAYLAQYSYATPDIYIDGVLNNGVEVFRPGTVVNPIAGDDFTATPIIYTLVTQNPMHADGFSIVNDYGAPGDNIVKADIKLYSGSVQNPTLLGTETIDNMADVTSTTRYAFSRGYDNITSIKILVYKTLPAGTQAANGMQMGELGLYSNAGSYCGDLDTDEDGTPNRLDSDSDGDSCSDALESGASSSTTANFAFTGTMGANGLDNSLETAVDNGSLNYTSTYNSAKTNGYAACLDTDNDGVLDLTDLDDDNDGVLDSEECPPFDINKLSYVPGSYAVTNGASASQTFPAAPDGLVVNVFTLDNSFNVRINGTHLTNPQELQFWASAPTDALFEFLDGTTYSAVWGIVGNKNKPLIRVYINNVGRIKVYGSRTSGGALEEMRLRNGSFNTITLNTNAINTFQIGQAVVAQTFISGDYGVIVPPNCDDDNDGIPNGLDLDSDGDGCPDAKEAGVSGTLLSGDVKNGSNGAVTSTTSLPNAIAGSAGNYGANGLANVVETSTESGVVSYSSTYTTYARSSTLKVCLDTDADGVADIFDIDDDNDGILDTVEQADCVYSGKDINTVTFSGTAVTAKTANSITSSNTNSWISSYSSDNFALPLSFKFKRPTVGNSAMIGLLPAYGTQSPTSYTNEDYKFYVTSTNVNVPFGTTYNVTQTATAQDEYSIDISATGYVTMKINGVQKAAFQGVNSAYKISVAGLTTTVFTDVRLTNPANPEVLTCLDIDNDGKPNYLDLDSDGDGCSDAREAGSSTTATSTSVYPIGTDLNNNGLLNNYEVGTTGTINYTSTYTNFALNSALNACIDSDSDGAPDVIDLDDDNDGVLDSVEENCNIITTSKTGLIITKPSTINYTFNSNTINNLIDGVDNNVYVAYAPTGTLSNSPWFNFEFPTPKALTYLEIGHYLNQYLFSLSSTYKIQGSSDNSIWTDVSGTLTYNNVATSTSGGLSSNNSNIANFASNRTAYKYYRIYGISGAAGTGWSTEIYFKEASCVSDVDGDGVINSLDLDSDGDSCPDTREAGITTTLTSGSVANKVGNVTSTTTVANAIISGTFGANGFANSVETAAESGLYSGTYTYDFALDANVSTCLDTDNDGVSDILDLDDDNDGILDVTEYNCEVSTMSKTGITVSSTVTWGYNGGTTLNNLVNGTEDLTAYTNGDFLNQTILQFNLPSAKVLEQIEVSTQSGLTTLGTTATYNLEGWNGSAWVVIERNKTIGGTSAPTRAAGNSYKFLMPNNLTAYSKYRIFGTSVKGTYNSSSWIQEAYFFERSCVTDVDSDGIPNWRDSDSDGDSCPDAVEAGTTAIGTSGVTSNDRLSAGTIPAPYSSNGFATGLETAAGSGVYAGTYTYNLALDASVNACTDTDGDGVANAIDLDDDNDGVLDATELNCVISILAKTGITVSSTVTWGYSSSTLANLVNGKEDLTAYSTSDFLDQTILQFDFTAAKALNLIEISAQNSGTTLGTTGKYNVQGWNGTKWINILTNQTFAMTAPVLAPANSYTIKMPFNTTAYTKYRLFGTSTKGTVSTTTWLQEAYFTEQSCNLDADNDGIPNSQDSDSDSDGCSDTIEAGVLGLTTSYGANGFSNALETNESGVYNGTYSYQIATDGTFSACRDTDNDGVTDVNDIDDDNDGILDSIECPATEMISNGSFDTGSTGWTVGAGWTFESGLMANYLDGATNTKLSQIIGRPYPTTRPGYVDFKVDVKATGYNNIQSNSYTASLIMQVNDIQYAVLTNPGNGSTTATVQTSNGALSSINSFPVELSSGPFTTVTISIPSHVFYASNNVAIGFTAGNDDFRIDNVSLSTSPNLAACDTDGDGVPNSRDLDSDGDGCFDAAEAKTVTSLSQSTVSSPFGNNGFSDSNETSAESGVYTGNYILYARATDASIKSCTDTDFDGVPDIDDLDDDNDGLLDYMECDTRAKKILFAGSTEDFSTMRSSLYAEFNNNKAPGATIVQSNIIESATVPAGFYDGYDMVVFGGAAFNAIHANHWAALRTAIQNKTSNAFVIESDNCCVAGNQSGLINLLNGVFGTSYALSASHPTATETYPLNNNSTYASVFGTSSLSGANYFPVVGVATSDILFYSATSPTAALAGMKQIPGSANKSQFVAWFVDGTITQGSPWYTTNQNKIAKGFYDSYKAFATTCNFEIDTDNDGIPNQLDLDSDGDGCSDANEAYSSSTAQGTDGNSYYGTGTPPTVDASGKVTTASYTATSANTLTVGRASVITAQPVDVNTLPNATNITYAATVTPGSGTTTYQWQVSTNGGGTWTNITNNATYSGATTASLTISTATIAMKEYRYRLNIAQSDYICGNLTSSAARLIMTNTPTVTDDVATAIEDTPLNGSVLTNDTGSGGSAITVTSFTINGTTYTAGQTASIPNVGTFTLRANGTYTFTPAANYNGAVPVISYLATDANGGADTGDLSISITAVNDPVVVVNETVSTNQGTVATGSVLTNDTDADGNTLTVTQFTVSGVAYNVGDVVSIPGKGTITVAANGTYTFTPIATYSGAVPVIGYTVSDGNGSSVDGTLTINVVDVNDAPLAADDITTTLQNTPVSGNVLTNDSDPENNTLSITKITIAGVDYPAGTTATIANVGTIIVNADGTYSFTPTSNFTGAAPTITYMVSDGTTTSTAALKIAVTAVVNANPVAVADTKTTAEDTPATGNVLTNDTDAEGNTLSLTSFTINGVTYPAGTTANMAGVGTVVVHADGTYTFTPLANYAGSVPAISYAISDGNGGTANGTLTVSITPANDAPISTDDVATATEDSPVSGNVLTNDSDVEGNTLSVTQFVINGTTYPAGQTATLAGVGTFVMNANGTFTFTPEANYSGAVPAVTYTVSDGNGATDTGDLTVNITPVNDAPVASDDAATTPQGSVKTGDIVTGADTDLDGNTLTLTQFKINGVTYPAGSTANIPGVGTLQINADGTYTFTPLPAYVGTVPTVEYTLSDGNGGTDTGNFVITVTDVNDAPAAARDEQTINQNNPASGNLLTNDSDADGNTLSVTQFVINGVTTPVDPTNGGTYTLLGVGTFVVSANGNYTFTPLNTYVGTTPALTYTVSDGTATATSTLTVYVQPFDTAPVAVADANTIAEDGVATGNVLSNDTDAESDPLSVTQFTVGGVSYPAGTTATIPNVGTLVVNADGTFTFTPLANYNGTVPAISYLVSDGAGATATGQLSITVTAVNDVPVAVNDQASTAEDTALTGNVKTNDSDVDGNALTLIQFTVGGQTYTAGQTANISGVGSLQMNADGSFSFTPAANYNGAFSAVTYTISDGNGGTATANLAINITAVNDAPVASNDTATTPQGSAKSGDILTGADTDVDGNTLTLSQFSIGGVTYPAGTTANIPGVGTLIINADGTYTFTPLASYVGTVPTVTYTLADGNGGTATGTFILTVTDVPEPPVATDDASTVGKNAAASGNLVSNDSDPESNTLTIASYSITGVTGPFTLGSTVTIPNVGTMRVNADGTYVFTPLPIYSGNVPAVTYTVSDGNGGTDTGLLNITVIDTNTPPTATNDPVTTTEDTPRSGNVLTNDSDPNGDAITVVSFVVGSTTYPAGSTATIPNVGTITIAANGAFTFTPFANYNGTVPAVNYTITDGLGGVTTGALNITVSAVNDTPIAVNDDNVSGPEDSPITGNVLANDSDPDGTPINVSQFTIAGVVGTFTAGQTATIPGKGTLEIRANGAFTFTPDPNYYGPVPTITYTAVDGSGASANATLNMAVTPVNDPPTVVNDVITVPEGTTGTGNVLTNDSDIESGTLAVTQFTINGTIYTPGSIVSIPNVGTFVLNADGTYSFTGVPNYSGAVPVVSYTATDGTGGTSTGTLTVTIQNVNDAPVVVSETVITPEDTPATGNVLTNDTDPEATPLSITQFLVGGVSYNVGQTATIPGAGTVTISSLGAYVFTPVSNYFGNVPPVIYTVSDGQATTTGSLTISVTSVNDAPVAVNDTKVGEVNANVAGNVLTNDSDVENGTLSVVDFVINGTTYPAGQTATIPNVGTVTMNADGTYTFVPALNYAGTLPAITYNISDGAGGTASATLALTITFDTDGDGIPDAVEKGPGIAPDTDGDGIPDYKDLDSDNDGILDSVENAACSPAVMPCDIDGDGIPNYLDTDSDGDGISDVIEAGGTDANSDGKVDGAINSQGVPLAANGGLTPPNTDGTGASNPYDVDSDGDGIPDSVEGTRDTDGDGTPDYKDVDSDSDGISDAIEGSADADGDGTPNYRDLDSDGDSIPDVTEGIVDTDTDGTPNFLDTDSDGDSIPDSAEGTADTDGDGTPDYKDLDSDGDGIPDSIEGTTDTDGDGIPNYKDTDSDGDGIADAVEKGSNPLSPRDTDGDGIPDYKDLDSDADGIPDSVEGATDTDNDGLPNYMDPDSDGDGIPDSVEKGINPLVPLDTDGDGTADYLDTDSDNDGISDAIEKGPNPAQPLDTDGDGIPDYRDLDSDNDGITDAVEGTVDTDGDGTPNYRDLDSDADGKPDQQEGVVDTDGDTTPNYLDPDSDGDGVLDTVDQCPLVAGNLASGCPLDSDNDGVPDSTDFDDDNDGILDSVEDAACAPAAPTCDTDGDGIPNNLDPDSDNDGITDVRESNGTDVDGDGVVDGAVDSNGVPTSANGGVTPPNTDGTGGFNPYDTDSDGDGIPDSIEKGSNGNAPLDSDNDNIPNYLDTDSDGDGIPDSVERGTGTAIADTDGDGTPDYLDLDSDGDGITDAVEGTTDTDGDGIPNFRDVDSDGDGIPDSIEGTTDTDNDSTPNYLDTDSDGDGISDSIEKGPNPLSPIDTDNDGTPDYKDLDSDGDGIPDITEGSIDTDSDGIPNYRDLDSDGDGISDSEEGTTDTDNDGIPNYKDLDSDADGISDATEGTLDTDGDGTPNYKDLDSDGDGISDAIEGTRDTDGDGMPDYLDLDSDGDGISDNTEKGPNPTPLDSDGDGTPNYRDLDSDGDGIPDAIEGTVDSDGDNRPDYLDTDSDADGIPDAAEGNVDTDGDSMPDYLDLDSDGDGVLDATDACRVTVGDVSNNGCPTDFDNDGIIDSLDSDDDNDGILDTIENAACNPVSVSCDTDGDGTPNRFDLDSDGDGIKDVREANGIDVNADGIVDGAVDSNGVPTAANGGLMPPNTDGTGGLNPYDTDSDGDGIPDSAEKGTNGNVPRDTDGDGTPDYLDLDSDGDGITDAVEGNVDTDGDGIPNYRDLDSDGDGVIDATEVVDGTSPTNACSLTTAHQTLAAPGWSAADCDGDGNPNSTDPHLNAPTAQNDNFVISGSGQQAFNILANDDFLAGGGVTINRLAGSAGGTALGTVSFNANTGMLMYTPAQGEISGVKTVVYQVCKGIVCATATANLNFCDSNNPTLDCDGDGVTNGQETTDGTDPLNACSLVRGSQTLTPSSAWTSGDCDGDGNPNSTDPNIATAVANNDLVQVAGSGAQTYNILANDDFLPGNSTIARLSGNAGGTALGTVSFNNATGEMTYTPAVGETSGTKTVVYQVCKNSVCATATVTLSFCNPNDPTADCDGDGVTNGQEAIDGTNPNDACSLNFRSQSVTPSSAWLAADCDGDGVTNGVERTDRTDPTDACSLLLTSQVLANASSGWLAADCDGDGNPNGTDDAPLDFCIDGSGQVPANGTAAYDIFRYQDCDNDGILNGIECTLGVTCPDFDGDGIPNYLDTDSDNDQIADISERDIDSDGDGSADYIDLDSDNDGILDKMEGNQDADGDGIPNYLDLDSDGDGILDTVEATADYRAFEDGNGDGRIDSTGDRNYNGIPDQLEPAFGGRPLEIPDTDKDGIPDFLDVDSDGDGIADSLEGRGDMDGDQHPNYRDGDSDGDGLSDSVEKAGDPDGDGTPNFLDLDSDGDGISDQYEGLGLCTDCGRVDNNDDGFDDRAQQDARYPAIDTDKDGIPDFLDVDTDGDGILDAVEGIVDTDGDGIPNFRDTDSDNDGILDAIEGTVDSDGDGMPNYLDLDSDNDGIPDAVEGIRDTDGDGKPDYVDTDSDNDGIPDAFEAGKDPKNPVDTDGDGLPDYRDVDSDNDGISDTIEAGKDPKNPVDTDKDGIPDFRDTDSDNDGIPDAVEAGKDPKNPVDTDKDGIPDYQDVDSDNDGISDAVEAGKDPINPVDTDGDGLPDYRDLDSDNDGIPDAVERARDSDGDGIADYRDLDSDNDGISDAVEAGKDPKRPVDSDGDGTPDYRDIDSDNDGIPDFVEGKRDTDGDGLPDYLDVDSDNDGYSDKHEAGTNPANPVDTDKDGIPDYRDLDSDADGITDQLEDDLNYGAMPDCDNDGIENRIDPDQCETFAPQGISPNGDGQNDVLIIPGIMRKGNNTLTIYNRWGNIVYQKDNYQNDWGGQTDRAFNLTSDDNLLPDGTYYYVIDFKGKYPEVGQYVYINRLEK